MGLPKTWWIQTFLLVIVFLGSCLGQTECGTKYYCGEAATCLYNFCVCSEGSSETDPWAIHIIAARNGRKLLYCRKLCTDDPDSCPPNKTCTPISPERSSCDCSVGLNTSLTGHCVHPSLVTVFTPAKPSPTLPASSTRTATSRSSPSLTTTQSADTTRFSSNSTTTQSTGTTVERENRTTLQTTVSTLGPTLPVPVTSEEDVTYVYIVAGVSGACAILFLVMVIVFISWQTEKRRQRRKDKARPPTIGQMGVTNGIVGRPTFFDYSSPFPARQMQENGTIANNLDTLRGDEAENQDNEDNEGQRDYVFTNPAFTSSADSGAGSGSLSTGVFSTTADRTLKEERNIVMSPMYTKNIHPLGGHVDRSPTVRDDQVRLIPASNYQPSSSGSRHMYDNPGLAAVQQETSSRGSIIPRPTAHYTRF